MTRSTQTISKTFTQKKSDDFFPGDQDPKKILRQFLRLNNLKLERTQNSLKNRQLDFLQLLPLLFHINHPLLPGFISSQCPSGIPKFIPDKEGIRCAKRLARSFEYKRHAYRQYDIHALYFMGSTGTIAYSDKSDFDVWVCHREDLSSHQLQELQLKTERITQWCSDLKLEVNFFLINPEYFRQGKIDRLSSESSGTAQHILLLEEFYRTSILLAGRYPIWWLVPPQFEKDYDTYVQKLPHEHLIAEQDFLNFGSITDIPAEEFYGATIWHIYKGIDSPYKSILKLLLMECYAKEHPDIDLLCLRFKQSVYETIKTDEQPNLDVLDPYIMMMDKITEHLIKEKSLNRLDLARQCLYLKVNESLSQLKNAAPHEWRQQIMHDLVASWEWEHIKIVSLDSRSHWKIEEVNEEHRNIIEALTYSYRKLSDFFRYQNKDIRISKRDLHILGRKLYAAFEKRAGKIEVLSHDTEIDLHESHVSLHPFLPVDGKKTDKKETGWALYIGVINSLDKTSPAPVKKSTHLLELLCWAYFNRVISSHSNFVLGKEILTLNTREIKQIIETLEQTFPDASCGYASMDDLAKPAQLDLNILFLNIGIDPFLNQHALDAQIATRKTDALNYGGMHRNLLFSIDQVLLNSWREIITQHYDSEHGLIDCLCQYLKWNHETEATKESPIPKRPTQVYCFSSVRGESISRRIKQLFNEVLNAFHGIDNAYTTRYLVSIQEIFYLLWQDETGPKYKKIPNQKELIRELSYPLSRFNRLVIDQEFSGNSVLKLIYHSNKENHIQLFYQNHHKSADIYIVDERGSLYHHSTTFDKNSTHINHFILFLDSAINRLSFNSNFDSYIEDFLDNSPSTTLDNYSQTQDKIEETELEMQLEVFEIQQQSSGELILKDQFSKLQSMPDNFLKIQVIVEMNTDGSRRYLIYANAKEFSSFEHGNDLYNKVAEEVVSTRKNHQRYPIYITDIDLSQELRDSESNNGLQITQLLKFKQEVERRLNQAIKNL